MRCAFNRACGMVEGVGRVNGVVEAEEGGEGIVISYDRI